MRKSHIERITALIEHEALDPFEPLLKSILELGFDGGIRALNDLGYKLGDDLVDNKANECFKNGIFLSFAQAQSVIGVTYAELMRKNIQLSDMIKRFRREKKDGVAEIEEQSEAVQNRLVILKRLMDGILWVLLPGPWIFEHLIFQSHSGTSDPDELMKLVSIATEQNQGSKRELHIVTDLTNLVQLGDIIRIRWDENGLFLRVQEIKTGKVNAKIEDLIFTQNGDLSLIDLDRLEVEIGPSAKKQAIRILKQRERLKQIDKIGQPFILPENKQGDKVLRAFATVEEPPRIKTYISLLPRLVADARKCGISVLGVDRCLFLLGVSKERMKMLDDVKQLPHWLFHLKYPDLDCTREEIGSLNKEYPLVNLVTNNMNYVMSRSPLIWYPKDLVLDVVMGKVLVYAQFDLDIFFQMAADVNIQLSLFTGKKTLEDKRGTLSQILKKTNSYGVKAKFSNNRELRLKSSLLMSVYTQLVDPADVLNLIKTFDKIQQGVE